MTSGAQEQFQAKSVAVVVVVVVVVVAGLNNLTQEIDGEEGLKLTEHVTTLRRWADNLSNDCWITFNDFSVMPIKVSCNVPFMQAFSTLQCILKVLIRLLHTYVN